MFNFTMNSLLEAILEAASSANVSAMEVFREVAGSAEILAEVTRASFEQNANWLREFSETSEALFTIPLHPPAYRAHRNVVSRCNLGLGDAILQSRTNDRQALSGLCSLGL